ncbi:alanine racemase, partial [bacterium]|nr:alanine racemase [bacterium]
MVSEGGRAGRRGPTHHRPNRRRLPSEDTMPATTTVRQPTWIELSESALRSNLQVFRRRIGRQVRFTSVVKGNAYGHSIDCYVPLAERCGVRHFAVFSAAEAEAVVAARTRASDVMIMGHIDDHDLAWAIERGLAFYVFDLGRLDAAIAAARKVGKPARVHLEVETGLHRTGLSRVSLRRAVSRLEKHGDHVRAEGLCTHFAGAESFSNYFRIQRQIERFAAMSDLFAELGHGDAARHTACSAAVFNYPEHVHDLVRVGIGQYGYWPSQETRFHHLRHNGRKRREPVLKRVLSWKSRVMNLKTVPEGEFVGYGNTFQATRRMRLAAVPVGYYHGFGRDQSNLGHVLIRGARCPVVGVVNMNMLTVDTTDLDQVRTGDEVVLIGRQGEQD